MQRLYRCVTSICNDLGSFYVIQDYWNAAFVSIFASLSDRPQLGMKAEPPFCNRFGALEGARVVSRWMRKSIRVVFATHSMDLEASELPPGKPAQRVRVSFA